MPNFFHRKSRVRPAVAFGAGCGLAFALLLVADFCLGFYHPSPDLKCPKKIFFPSKTSAVGIRPVAPLAIPIEQWRKPACYPAIPTPWILRQRDVPGEKQLIGSGRLRIHRSNYRSIGYNIESQREIWNTEVLIDRFGRRLLPGEEKKQASRFLLMLGDSFTFGAGVKSEETYAGRLANALPNYRVYNYGIPGLFPGELLERLRLIQPRSAELPEHSGIALYFFAGYQLYRNMGNLSILGSWGGNHPFYHVTANGEIRAEKTFAEEFPWRVFFARLLARSNLISYFQLVPFSEPSESDWKFQVELIRQLRGRAADLGVEKFFVVLPPDSSEIFGREASDHFERAGIPYIDFSSWDLDNLTPEQAYISYDGHFTAEGHRVFAQALLSWVPWD